ncbi:hypothetical protein [uncultured Photobacterium sp.]|uniref:hypothetical protein n=1 Tax=uncultured Photobacterium sp. TaxID=173973 RepID=UPI0026129753|nr:hypothetical protein [uncultured Photobacterium sp.]
MVDFNEKMRLKGKAEEDLYFAELDRKLIEALHEKQAKERTSKSNPDGNIELGAQDQQK